MTTPEPPAVPEADQPTNLVREALAIGAFLLTLVAGGIWFVSSPVPSASHRSATEFAKIDPAYARYVGDSACGSCHPGELAAHRRSGHARTLRPVARSSVARGLDGMSAEDPEQPGVRWAFTLTDGKLSVERTEAGRVERTQVEYAFGSGEHATTFVSLVDRNPTHPIALEQRLTYYAHSKALGVTPGQSLAGHAVGNSPGGRLHSSSDTLKCFECHVTATSNRGPKVLDEATMIPNVSCERCHGPGRSHVDAARTGASAELLRMPEGPGRWTAREQMDQCGECHRTPQMVQPGSIRVDNLAMVRHQPVGLMQSACFVKSEGALSCVTCHDPHARTSTDRSAYEAVCLDCHRRPADKLCAVSPRGGCLDCHMPRREITRGMTMTDHWIRRTP